MPGIWTSVGSLNSAVAGHASCGSCNAALSFGGYTGAAVVPITEEFDGTTWSYKNSLNTARNDLGGCGTILAALSFGGWDPITGALPITEEFDGTTWSSGGDLNTEREQLGGCGTQTAALAIAGVSISLYLTSSEEYNGTAWSSGGDLSANRCVPTAFGIQTAAVVVGGYSGVAYLTSSEEYDGVAWAAGGALSIARAWLAGCGVQAAGLAFGGYTGAANTATTEEYDGAAWSSGGDLNTARNWFSGCGVQTGALSLGGFSWPTYYSVAELYSPLYPQPFRFIIGGGIESVARILQALGVTLDTLIVTPLAEVETLVYTNRLADYITSLMRSLNNLSEGDPFTVNYHLLSGIQAERGSLSIQNKLSDAITRLCSIKNMLSDSHTSMKTVLGELALKNDIQAVLSLITSLSDQTALYPDCTMVVYLDGKPITNRIQSVSMSMDRETLFDTITIGSVDTSLYLDLLDIVGSSTSYIEVQYKGTAWMFLVEEVSNYERSFSIWGRSIAAAKSDTPFESSEDFNLDTDTLASAIAAALVPELAVTWNVVDWTVLEGWSASGTPIQILQELASNVGAVVRSYPDGTGIHIEKRFLTRPVDLPYAASVAEFDRDSNLVSINNTRMLGTKDNAITVYGHSDFGRYSINIEADDCTHIGNSAEIRVYPGLHGKGYSLISSMGTPVYNCFKTVSMEEVVSFVGGKGSVQYPIYSMTSITWDGVTPSGFDYTIGQSEIVLDDDIVAALGTVKYYTSYDAWKLVRDNEGDILVVCVPAESGGIVALVHFDEGDREAESLDRSILTTLEAAIEAGTAWLDNNAYTKLIRAISAPCSSVVDGDIITIVSQESGVVGNAIVMAHSVEARRDDGVLKVHSNIQAVQFKK